MGAGRIRLTHLQKYYFFFGLSSFCLIFLFFSFGTDKRGLMNVPVVKCFVEFLGVGGMFGGGGRKIVPSAEIFLCTEEKIVGFFIFEHSIDRGNRRYTNGARG